MQAGLGLGVLHGVSAGNLQKHDGRLAVRPLRERAGARQLHAARLRRSELSLRVQCGLPRKGLSDALRGVSAAAGRPGGADRGLPAAGGGRGDHHAGHRAVQQ